MGTKNTQTPLGIEDAASVRFGDSIYVVPKSLAAAIAAERKEYGNIACAIAADQMTQERRKLAALLKAADGMAAVYMDALDAWDSDQESRVGKILKALTRASPGYRADIDAYFSALDLAHEAASVIRATAGPQVVSGDEAKRAMIGAADKIAAQAPAGTGDGMEERAADLFEEPDPKDPIALAAHKFCRDRDIPVEVWGDFAAFARQIRDEAIKDCQKKYSPDSVMYDLSEGIPFAIEWNYDGKTVIFEFTGTVAEFSVLEKGKGQTHHVEYNAAQPFIDAGLATPDGRPSAALKERDATIAELRAEVGGWKRMAETFERDLGVANLSLSRLSRSVPIETVEGWLKEAVQFKYFVQAKLMEYQQCNGSETGNSGSTAGDQQDSTLPSSFSRGPSSPSPSLPSASGSSPASDPAATGGEKCPDCGLDKSLVRHERCGDTNQENLGPKPTGGEEEWPVSFETKPVAWPINVMDGAEWNLLDATGTRIAICGFDADHKTGNFRHESKRIAWAIVGMIRNLKVENEVLRSEVERLAAAQSPAPRTPGPELDLMSPSVASAISAEMAELRRRMDDIANLSAEQGTPGGRE